MTTATTAAAAEHPPRPGAQGGRAERPAAATSSASPPAAPPGHGIVAPCRPPKKSATAHQPAARPPGDPGQHAGRRRARTARAPPRRTRRPWSAATTGSASTFAGHGHQADPTRDRRDHRRRDQVRGGGHRDRLGHPDRHPAARAAPAPTPARSPAAPRSPAPTSRTTRCRQRRVPQQQRRASTADSAGSAARGRPSDQRGQRDRRPSPPPAARSATAGPPRTNMTSTSPPTSAAHPRPGPRPAQHQQHRADDDRAVRAADRDQVGQPGQPEPLGQHRVEAGGVAVDQPGQQAALLVGQPGRRPAQRRCGPRPPPAATTAGGRAAAAAPGRTASRDSTPPSRSGCSVAVEPHALPGQHVAPRPRRRRARAPSPSTGTLAPRQHDRLGAGLDRDPRRAGRALRRQHARVGGRRSSVDVTPPRARWASATSGEARAWASRPASGTSTRATQNSVSASAGAHRAGAPASTTTSSRRRTPTSAARQDDAGRAAAPASTTASHAAAAPTASRRSSGSRTGRRSPRSSPARRAAGARVTPSPARAARRT